MYEWYIEEWITDSEKNKIIYSQYWNDDEVEKSKEWYVLNGNFSKMEQYLWKTGLSEDLKQCINILKTNFNRLLSGVGIDLAAGNLWAAPYLFDYGDVDKLYCLEYSMHRLTKLGPVVLEHYNVPKEKIVLVLGNFYNLHIDDNTLDFVFMSSAFHHAEKPDKLLEEICRVLKPEGVVIIIGEHIVKYYKYLIKHLLKFTISRLLHERFQQKLFGKTFRVERLLLTKNKLLSPDSISGDHYYTDKEYRIMFSKYGFRMKQLKNQHSIFQSFVLVRNELLR